MAPQQPSQMDWRIGLTFARSENQVAPKSSGGGHVVEVGAACTGNGAGCGQSSARTRSARKTSRCATIRQYCLPGFHVEPAARFASSREGGAGPVSGCSAATLDQGPVQQLQEMPRNGELSPHQMLASGAFMRRAEAASANSSRVANSASARAAQYGAGMLPLRRHCFAVLGSAPIARAMADGPLASSMICR